MIRVYYTRIIGEEGINLLSIVMPTYLMMVTISTFMLPITISKLVAEGKKRSISIIQNSIFVISAINIITILLIFIFKDFIATTCLNEPNAKYVLIAMSLTLPFISLSSIIKGYFLGKQRTEPYMISNILEQLLRLIIIIIFLPILVKNSYLHAVIGLMLLTIFSESFSVLIFTFFMPKKVSINKDDLKYSKKIRNEILGLSVPTVSSKIIGNIGYFFEPIILTNLLMYSGYTSSFVISEYAAFNAYAIPILTIPAFFIQALSQTILPEISKYQSQNNKKMITKRIYQSLIFTFVVGIFFSIFINFFHTDILRILYDTSKGSQYIKILAPFFVLFYLEGILYSILQALGKAKLAFQISVKGVLIKLIVLIILSLAHIALYSLVVAEIINIIYIVFKMIKYLKKDNYI